MSMVDGLPPNRVVVLELGPLVRDAGVLLAILAIAGRPIAPDYLGALAEWPAERVRDALAALVRRGVVAEMSGTVRRLCGGSLTSAAGACWRWAAARAV